MTRAYWMQRKATGENGHLAYVGVTRNEQLRSMWLVARVKEIVSRDAAICEVGCGCGRNLWYLMRHGFGSVAGIEVNAERRVIANLTTGAPIHEAFPDQSFDLVYSMACLEHIPDLTHVRRIGIAPHGNLLTIEGEIKRPSERHFPRNYRDVFEPLGWVQREQWESIPGLGHPCYIARWFTRAD